MLLCYFGLIAAFGVKAAYGRNPKRLFASSPGNPDGRTTLLEDMAGFFSIMQLAASSGTVILQASRMRGPSEVEDGYSPYYTTMSQS